jgi:hypothetical protein
MAADSQECMDEAESDARMEIQDIIECLKGELCVLLTLVIY